MNKILKIVLSSAFTLFSLSAFADEATCVNIAPHEIIKIEVTGQNGFITGDYETSARGWGSHFAGGLSNDGYGSTDAECHLTPTETGTTLTALCYDGYNSQTQHHNEFRLQLDGLNKWDDANKKLLQNVTWLITKREVKIQATRIAVNGYNEERTPYIIEATFPLRESSGFWRKNQFCYSANGILNSTAGNFTGNPSSNRIGSGYIMKITLLKSKP